MRVILLLAGMAVTLGTAYAQCSAPFATSLEPPPAVLTAGGLLTVSNIRAPEGAFAVQTEAVLDQIDRQLHASGSRLANAVSVTVSLANQSDFATMNEIYRRRFPGAPPARTTIIVPLSGTALIELSVTAVPDGAERAAVNPPGWLTTNPYSYGLKSGEWMFMSGLLSRDGRTNAAVKGTIGTQTWIVMQNAAAVLEAADMTFADVVSARIYLVPPARLEDISSIYQGYFSNLPPQPEVLTAQLTAPDYLVEISMTARKAVDRARGQDGR